MKEKLLAQLAPYRQEHLLAFWDELRDEERRGLAEQIGCVDLDLIDRLYRTAHAAENWAELAARAAAPPACGSASRRIASRPKRRAAAATKPLPPGNWA